MDCVYAEIVRMSESGAAFALVTLVGASGSTPQNAGAKLLVLRDGSLRGTIGGGCMEAEARREGLAAIRTGEPRLFTLRLDDDFGWDDGLICGGGVTLFVDPTAARSLAAYEAAASAVAQRERGSFCTVTAGPAAAAAGLAAFVRADGTVVAGNETRGIALPRAVLDQIARACTDSDRERPTRVEPSSGLEVYVEPIAPPPVLLIAGAGHLGAAIASVGATAGFQVAIVDDRPAFANAARIPVAHTVAVAEIPDYVRDFVVDGDTYVVIVTRGHRHDAQVLRECVRSPAKYVGMIGSKRKVAVIYEEMLREGHATADELLRVHAPMGLALGDRDVGEIAVSVVAELIAVRRGADTDCVRSMRYAPPCLRDL